MQNIKNSKALFLAQENKTLINWINRTEAKQAPQNPSLVRRQ